MCQTTKLSKRQFGFCLDSGIQAIQLFGGIVHLSETSPPRSPLFPFACAISQEKVQGPNLPAPDPGEPGEHDRTRFADEFQCSGIPSARTVWVSLVARKERESNVRIFPCVCPILHEKLSRGRIAAACFPFPPPQHPSLIDRHLGWHLCGSELHTNIRDCAGTKPVSSVCMDLQTHFLGVMP
jgi:hypothetical protein